jgi:hypothetical protein
LSLHNEAKVEADCSQVYAEIVSLRAITTEIFATFSNDEYKPLVHDLWLGLLVEDFVHPDWALFHLHDPNAGWAEDDDEEHWQEKQDHRHGELGRQARRLFLSFRHAHVAVLLRHHA